MRLSLLLLLALAPLARGGEADGGHAHPERWTHPRGPASGTGRSLARAPESFGGILWTYQAKEKIVATPVTWDGAAFLFDGAGSLVALDVETGRVLARATVKAAEPPRPAVDRHSVFFLEEGDRLAQYHLEGRRLERVWAYSAGAGASAPRIHDGEIYLAGPEGLLRLRAGRTQPVWTAKGDFRGEPAVFGAHVYALLRADGAVHVSVRSRADGAEAARVELSRSAEGAADAQVAASEELVAAHVGGGTYEILSRADKDGGVVLEKLRTAKLALPPLVGRSVVIGLDESGTWQLLRKDEKHPAWPLVSKEDRPDLVVGAAPATTLQDKQCFGTWLADVNANRIYWHLDERKDVREFARGLEYSAVPARHERLLVVPAGAKTLHLIGPEVIGE